MVVIELRYTASIDEIDQRLGAHRDFLQKNYDAGHLLASGPQNPRTGGIIISLHDLQTTKEFMQADPFQVNNLADYRFIEFDAVKMHPALRAVI